MDRQRARLASRPGQLTLIWRAEGLADVLQALHDGFGAISVMPVYPAPERLAIRVIVIGRYGAAERRMRTLARLT